MQIFYSVYIFRVVLSEIEKKMKSSKFEIRFLSQQFPEISQYFFHDSL